MKKMKKLLLLMLIIFSGLITKAQINFQKTYSMGSSGFSVSLCGQQTIDGGFVIGGVVVADTNNWNQYLHLIKTDGNGIITQEKTFKTYGGNFSNHFMQQTSDGGYVISNYNYILKTDASFNIQWSKEYANGSFGEYGTTIHQTLDGGYIVSSDVHESGSMDFSLTKLDANGIVQWTKITTQTSTDYRNIELATQQTIDGGYIICGFNYTATGGQKDICIVKRDATGGILWSETIGGTSDDEGFDIIQTSTGEYIVTGATKSFGAGQVDIFLMKLSSIGNIIWAKTYGGTGDDYANQVKKTNDGGFVIAGYTESFGNGGDVLLIKTDSTGNILWSKTYGSSNEEGQGGTDVGLSLAKTNNDGYFVTSFTTNTDFTFANSYVIRTDSIGNSGCVNYQNNVSLTTLTPFFVINLLTLTETAIILLNNITVADTVITLKTIDCFASSVNEIISTDDINIFPNPSNGQFTINEKGQRTMDKLEIYNLLGEKIYTATNNKQQKTYDIDISNSPKGFYFVKIFVKDKIYTEKIVIQ